MSEIWFYHLDQTPVEQVLPILLEKARQRNWRALVRFASQERLQSMDRWLWTYKENSFLAHGVEGDEYSELQPILLCLADENRNQAQFCLCLEGADPLQLIANSACEFTRIVVLFNGDDENELASARQLWTKIDPQNYERSYWQLDSTGKWQKKA